MKEHVVEKSLPALPRPSWVSDGEMIPLVKGLPCQPEALD